MSTREAQHSLGSVTYMEWYLLHYIAAFDFVLGSFRIVLLSTRFHTSRQSVVRYSVVVV